MSTDRLDFTVPLSAAGEPERGLLIRLAEQHVDSDDRPCLDGETTLQDWADHLRSSPAGGHG